MLLFLTDITLLFLQHFNAFCKSENRNKYSTFYSLNGSMMSLIHHKILLHTVTSQNDVTSSEDEIFGMQNIFCQENDRRNGEKTTSVYLCECCEELV